MTFPLASRLLALPLAGAVLTFALAVAPWSRAEPPPAGAVAPATVQGSVHSIQLMSIHGKKDAPNTTKTAGGDSSARTK